MQLTVIMADKQDLHQFLNDNFTLDELEELTFTLERFAADIEFENLPGDTRSAKARELVDFMERRGLLPQLIETLQQKRPELIVPVPDPPEVEPPKTEPLSSAQKLNRLALVAGVGALALLAIAVAVVLSRRGSTTSQPPATPTGSPPLADYHVALTVGEECPEEWGDILATRIKENVDAATPARPVVYGTPEEAALVLVLACSGETVVWTAQWTDPAPIFEIVGSPVDVEIVMPLNLDDSDLLGRALIHYGQNNYNSARNALAQLANRVDAPHLQLLYANTLLLTEEFTDTVEAYTRLIADTNGDLLALAYNNRGLAHLDEYHRQETRDIISQEEQQLALSDLAQAQSLLTVESTPEVRALVNSNVGVFELLLMFPDKDMDAITDRADAACRAAEVAEPGSAWMRVCRAAVIIDKRKFEREIPCEPDLYADAEHWLTEAQEPQPEIAAVYYWRALLLVLNAKGCDITPPGEMSFMEQCVEWKQRLVTLREGGWAPLYLHVYLEDVFARCSVLIPET